ncbi:MAG: site-specific integrase [Actinomycetota bacterium]|nr:site-specific integrase [Actinomycetota bacterium]
MAAPNAGMDLPAQPMTPAEVAAIIGACSARSRTGIRNRALLMLLYRSGLRISEALALRPADVNLERRSLRLLDTKSASRRPAASTRPPMTRWPRWIDTRRQLGFRGGPLFCTLDGTPLPPQYVRNVLGRLAVKAGVDKRVHPHDFQQTFAVELEQAGTPVTVISKLLGHSSVAVTSRYFDHLTNRQAVTALGAVCSCPTWPASRQLQPPRPRDCQAAERYLLQRVQLGRRHVAADELVLLQVAPQPVGLDRRRLAVVVDQQDAHDRGPPGGVQGVLVARLREADGPGVDAVPGPGAALGPPGLDAVALVVDPALDRLAVGEDGGDGGAGEGEPLQEHHAGSPSVAMRSA